LDNGKKIKLKKEVKMREKVITLILVTVTGLFFMEGCEVKVKTGELDGWLIALDPGHGGPNPDRPSAPWKNVGVYYTPQYIDPGNTGWGYTIWIPNYVWEDEVNLDVALRLKKLIEGEGGKVFLTRKRDVRISTRERVKRANNSGAHRFISIHHNNVDWIYYSWSPIYDGYIGPHYNGTETYWPDTRYYFKDGKWYAENGLPMEKEIRRHDVSNDLAHHVHRELCKELGLPDRRVKRKRFYVLRMTKMPAILTEASFLSCPDEARRLHQGAYRQREAHAIFQGILNHAKCFSPNWWGGK
jgi:N-acetylmuramoyl-L-alanine amidase